jgi:prolyl oligopeptidase
LRKKKRKTLLLFPLPYDLEPFILLNQKEGKSEVYRSQKVDFKSEEYESKQVFYTSKDGDQNPDDYHP